MLKVLSSSLGIALILSPALNRAQRGQETKPANSLEQLLQAAFVAKNPKVTRAKVLELRSIGMGAGPYLAKIERTVDIFPTCRWADCIVSIEKVSWRGTEVVVVGAGSYGDGPFRKVYVVDGTGGEAAASQTPDRMDPRIPAPIAAKYNDIRDAKDWLNPIVIIRAEGVEVRSRGLPAGHKTVPLGELRALIIGLPVADWPSGRIVLAQDNSLRRADRSDDQPIKQTHDAAERILNALGITVDWWPG